MPWENIGSVDTGDMPHEEEWILFCLGMAKNYVSFVCGDAPDDGELGIMWSDHDLGSYPSLGVWYELEEPCEYISACEGALEIFNESVSWSSLKKYFKNNRVTDDDESEEEEENYDEENTDEED